MAKLNKIQFLLVVSLMICSSYANHLLCIANANLTLLHYAPLQTIEDNPGDFTPQHDTIKVIVYLCSLTSFKNIIATRNEEKRTKLATELREKKYELLYLGIQLPTDEMYVDAAHIVSEFIHFTVKTESDIELFGEHELSSEYYLSTPSQLYKIFNEDNRLRERILKMSKK